MSSQWLKVVPPCLGPWISRALELGTTAADPPQQLPFGAEAWQLFGFLWQPKIQGDS
jgi:hypothetical protein